MNIVNERIHHNVFGEGTVISNENGRLSIQFEDKYGIKEFLYPEAFEKYLRLNNADVELSVMEDLRVKQVQAEAESARIKEEREEAERIRLLEKSKSTAQKKKASPKSKTSKAKSKRSSTESDISEDIDE